MSKTIPAALQAHYDSGSLTVCQCLKVTLADATVFGWTTTDVALVVSGVTYQPGLDVSALESNSNLSVNNMELRFLPEEIDGADLANGIWDGAAFEVFECNYMAPADGVNVLKRGTMGEVTFKLGMYVLEFRSLSQSLQQSQGIFTSKTCRARLGDAKCTKDLTAFTVTGTVTASSDRRHITDTARTEADEYFAEGTIEFLTGDNAGQVRKVKRYAADEFLVHLPLPYDVIAGDTYRAIAGCDKTLDTCINKFTNVLNFQGEPDLPGPDKLTRKATAQAQPATQPSVPAEVVDYTGSGA